MLRADLVETPFFNIEQTVVPVTLLTVLTGVSKKSAPCHYSLKVGITAPDER